MITRELRLKSDYDTLKKLQDESRFIEIDPIGDYPYEEYHVIYRCAGMISPSQVGYEHLVEIYLHADYPDKPPQVSFLSTIFHPNIASPIQLPTVQENIAKSLAEQTSEAERQRLLDWIHHNEKLNKGMVCLDVLELNWSPDVDLDVVCIQLGHMIQYKLKNPDSAFTKDAADWTIDNMDKLPIDNRELRDIESLEINIVDEQDLVEFQVDEFGHSQNRDDNDLSIEIISSL